MGPDQVGVLSGHYRGAVVGLGMESWNGWLPQQLLVRTTWTHSMMGQQPTLVMALTIIPRSILYD